MKSLQALRSPAITLTSFQDLPVFLISSYIVLRHVLLCLPLLLYPEDSNLIWFPLLLPLPLALGYIPGTYCC
jgi:hypothetical protein